VANPLIPDTPVSGDTRPRETALASLRRILDDLVMMAGPCDCTEGGTCTAHALARHAERDLDRLAASPAPGTTVTRNDEDGKWLVEIRIGDNFTDIDVFDDGDVIVSQGGKTWPVISRQVAAPAGTGTPTLAQLQSIEWRGDGGPEQWPTCPACQYQQKFGHKPGCWLAVALAAPAGTGTCGECRHGVAQNDGTHYCLTHGIRLQAYDGCRLGFSPRTETR
jgi:hypothetical protein